MAFSTTNVKRAVLGNLNVVYGNWSGAAGDAPGTITLSGGEVYLFQFNSNSQPYNADIQASSSVSGAIQTVTIYYNEAVTGGTFLIIHANG